MLPGHPHNGLIGGHLQLQAERSADRSCPPVGAEVIKGGTGLHESGWGCCWISGKGDGKGCKSSHLIQHSWRRCWEETRSLEMVSIASTASCFLYISARDEFVTTAFPCRPQIRQKKNSACLPTSLKTLSLKGKTHRTLKKKMHVEGVKKTGQFLQQTFCWGTYLLIFFPLDNKLCRGRWDDEWDLFTVQLPEN